MGLASWLGGAAGAGAGEIIKGAAQGIGGLAKDLRAAITGIDPAAQAELEKLTLQMEQTVEQDVERAVELAVELEETTMSPNRSSFVTPANISNRTGVLSVGTRKRDIIMRQCTHDGAAPL